MHRTWIAFAAAGVLAAGALAQQPHVAWAGARSSAYGIRPFPTPEGWTTGLKTLSDYFPGSTTVAIWIAGRLNGRTTGVNMEFPRPDDGVDYGPLITFADSDKHEAFLEQFDRSGIKVFLQAEPGYADVETCIDLMLKRYKHHPSVIGWGIDVEWFQNAKTGTMNTKATDELAKAWESRVKSHNSKYRLFVKHFHVDNLPQTYRGDVIFVDDSQQFKTLDQFLDEFKKFADFYYPSPVMFQIGYRADRPWWSTLEAPIPKTLGEKLASRVKQACGIIWVDFTLRDVVSVGEPAAVPTTQE